jgi:hypothetical protein
MKKLLMLLAVVLMASPAAAQLVITGVLDGPLSGGTPKVIELTACDDEDLGNFTLATAANGNAEFNMGYSFTLPSQPIAAGETIYLVNDANDGVAMFESYFGFAADIAMSNVSFNGDDVVGLFGPAGELVDVFGEVGVDGTGQPWEYLDGWAKRTTMTGPDGATFQLGSWTFSGPNALDGATDNATSGAPFTLGQYSCDGAVATDNATWDSLKTMYR